MPLDKGPKGLTRRRSPHSVAEGGPSEQIPTHSGALLAPLPARAGARARWGAQNLRGARSGATHSGAKLARCSLMARHAPRDNMQGIGPGNGVAGEGSDPLATGALGGPGEGLFAAWSEQENESIRPTDRGKNQAKGRRALQMCWAAPRDPPAGRRTLVTVTRQAWHPEHESAPSGTGSEWEARAGAGVREPVRSRGGTRGRTHRENHRGGRSAIGDPEIHTSHDCRLRAECRCMWTLPSNTASSAGAIHHPVLVSAPSSS
jgi:hypothetical protein